MSITEKKLLTTKEVAKFLGINEKMVYTLVSEKNLPASKVTGKWIFPQHLVEQWVEANTINFPKSANILPPYHGLLIITGSNDLLLEKVITLFNERFPEHLAVFGNLGSMGGIRSLKRNLCHMATSHLLQEDKDEYNFEFVTGELEQTPVIVNFCHREQGILLQKGNPKKIKSVQDFTQNHIKIVNRPLGTGTRLLFDNELKKNKINTNQIDGYGTEVQKHLDVGFDILAGRADAGIGIKPVSSILNLDFIPLRRERYDLLITKERFFDKGIQLFLGLLHEPHFHLIAKKFAGYDTALSGKMVYPQEQDS